MARWRHLESKEEIRKTFVIFRDGVFWRVRNVKRPTPGCYLSEHDAKIFVDKQVNELYNKQIKTAVLSIKKIKYLKVRCKEYRKLCQIVDTLSHHS